mgnify:CR=1 FL=1
MRILINLFYLQVGNMFVAEEKEVAAVKYVIFDCILICSAVF